MSRLNYLFDRHVQFQCTGEEEEELMSLLADPGNRMVFQQLIDKAMEKADSEIKMPGPVALAVLQNILRNDPGALLPNDEEKAVAVRNKTSGSKLWLRIAAAAIPFMVGVCAWYFFGKGEGNTELSSGLITETPVLPGKDRAVLTMADGTSVILDSMDNGILKEGNAKIRKKGALLIYNESGALASGASLAYNTLSTPRGGKYKVILPDGTNVWINSASSLKFPAVFIGRERKVELTGEAYFEVAENSEKPFRVVLNGAEVEVLGTHFNINSYGNEPEIRTTLLEGSVRLNNGERSDFLIPGQQARSDEKGNVEIIDAADIEEATAWLDGKFKFNRADIHFVMRQIARWYDVDVEYAGAAVTSHFGGTISRDVDLSQVLDMLQLTGRVKFEVKGKKVVVKPM